MVFFISGAVRSDLPASIQLRTSWRRPFWQSRINSRLSSRDRKSLIYVGLTRPARTLEQFKNFYWKRPRECNHEPGLLVRRRFVQPITTWATRSNPRFHFCCCVSRLKKWIESNWGTDRCPTKFETVQRKPAPVVGKCGGIRHLVMTI